MSYHTSPSLSSQLYETASLLEIGHSADLTESMNISSNVFQFHDHFSNRHIGPREHEIHSMLAALGVQSLAELVDRSIPKNIRLNQEFALPPEVSQEGREWTTLGQLKQMLAKNQVLRSLMGMGYYGCITPAVILRGILEEPNWYTPYTPYQPEIAQGRLEALINFQTMVSDLTKLPIANASLLDEATAAAEAMRMCIAADVRKRRAFFVAHDCHPQTIAVIKTQAEALDIGIYVQPLSNFANVGSEVAGLLLQTPTTEGRVVDYRDIIEQAKALQVQVVVATDLLALTLFSPPGEFGADIAVGSAQRFGVPLGYGGPHAGFLAAEESYKRLLPGRIIGVSRDAQGKVAYRMAMQTREQHIRRERATSNICTAQALLAVVASMYAIYHGPHGLRRIAERIHGLASLFGEGLQRLGHELENDVFFDTLKVKLTGMRAQQVLVLAQQSGFNLREIDETHVGISLDERSTLAEVEQLLKVFAPHSEMNFTVHDLIQTLSSRRDVETNKVLLRTSTYLEHPVFNSYHCEHELTRYMQRLQSRDLSLTTSMIPLGSCTMKLNASSEMQPITWPEVADMHPFVPLSQAQGYQQMIASLAQMLCAITGFAAVSFQPNAGSQGEYAGLLIIRAYHRQRGEGQRNICLIPTSAHGTNPASAVLVGMQVVAVRCDRQGNVELADLRQKTEEYGHRIAALMITYPSTHGVFEANIREICAMVHRVGGQVYLDGANMNAQVGLCRPGDYGADVCHLNLHKTFCIPHGGGGPGMGPIAVAEHLKEFLPSHPVIPCGGSQPVGTIAAAPWSSASILTISWMYIAMMGARGLVRATQVAILNANYMAKRLEHHYPILFRGQEGYVAHEFIIDLRPFKASAGIEVDDVAKRLMDYGFHAPTMSFPVAGTLMIEPTESESKAEMDRFCDALLAIRGEIKAIEEGSADRQNNVLKNAPHTAEIVMSDLWDRQYSRTQAAFPAPWLQQGKFWPSVGRIDQSYGDRNFFCTCPSMDLFT